jgi:hypothetical protein
MLIPVCRNEFPVTEAVFYNVIETTFLIMYSRVTNEVDRLVEDCQVDIASAATSPKRGAGAIFVGYVQPPTY